jgi:hypothetical protein
MLDQHSKSPSRLYPKIEGGFYFACEFSAVVARCFAIKASISSMSQTVTRSPSLMGFGNFPFATHRHIVLSATANDLATPAALATLCAISISRKTCESR